MQYHTRPPGRSAIIPVSPAALRRNAAGLLAVLLILAPLAAQSQKFYSYVGLLGPDHALLAWGKTAGSENSIGRNSASYGPAKVTVGSVEIDAGGKNWAMVRGLEPDTEYVYSVRVNGRIIGEGKFRTWPQKAAKLAYFVIGDYGNGSRDQHRIAAVMEKEFQRRRDSENPVRFVITTGDNIYADLSIFGRKNSGSKDSHWESKFFQPYEALIREIPFYPSLGNHDGDESEHSGDLGTYLDNFFFPHLEPARWYHFSYGGLADFFALDTTDSSEDGARRALTGKDGEQYRWLRQALEKSEAPWKIPYFHHPPFNAGPRHTANHDTLAHYLDLFEKAGVKAAFNGHEHNYQHSQVNRASRGIQFVISGAGGELRKGGVKHAMEAANIAGWAPACHFLLVEIEGTEMRITPLSDKPVKVVGPDSRPVEMPLKVTLPK